MQRRDDAARLAELTDDTRPRVEAALAAWAAAGIPMTITEAARSLERQQELVAARKSRTLYSWHRCGRAVDVMFLWRDGSRHYSPAPERIVDIDGPEGPIHAGSHRTALAWELVGSIGEEQGLQWGGHWQSLADLVHFQHPAGLTWERALADYASAPSAA